jgi:hypothetical protein
MFVVAGCAAKFQPVPLEEMDFKNRAQTQSEDNVRVTAVVLSAAETEAVFGVALYKKGIQPIWLEIENKDTEPTWFLPLSVDPDYFSPLEVTYPYHRTFDKAYNDKIDRHFLDNAMVLYLAPGSTRSGFVFTNLDLGTKGFNVDLVGDDNQPNVFTFFIPVPGLRADHEDVDFDNLYSADEMLSYDEAGFRNALYDLPCCATNEDGTKQGGPINIVIVADGLDMLRILIRAGWNETATTKDSDAAGGLKSTDIPQSFRYKPVAPLYYYGRPQDASFREPRAAGFERNQIRIWLTPMRVDGKEVWIGQIGREYGKQSAEPKNRKLDWDEVRGFLLQNIWYAQGLEKYAYVKNPDAAAPISQMKTTFRGTTYTTDGYRLIMWLSEESVALSDVEALDWDIPPEKQ